MNGAADLGGMMGFGPVIDDGNEPHFHAEWEPRVLGMVIALAACGKWNLDMSRYARESLPPAQYLSFSYYQIWLEAAIKLLEANEMITKDELVKGKVSDPPVSIKKKLQAKDVEAVLFAGGPVDRPTTTEPEFSVGQSIRTINDHPETHTRLPCYARDKVGTISRVFGCHVFPDDNAKGLGENPKWLYQVTFSSRDLWGEQGNDHDQVTLDLWEPYLRSAP